MRPEDRPLRDYLYHEEKIIRIMAEALLREVQDVERRQREEDQKKK